jgi:hypothetical protein
MNEFATRSGLLVAVVAITGFAIQQLLQLADPFVEAFIGFFKSWRTRKGELPLPNSMSEAEFKKSVMGYVAFGIGVAIAATTNIRLLGLLSVQTGTFSFGAATGAVSVQSVLDVIVSGFVIGAGTDGVNTLLKYIGYIKDARGLAVTNPQPQSPAPGAGQIARLGGPSSDQIAALDGSVSSRFDVPATQVGVIGNVTVHYDQQALGASGLALAQQLLTRVSAPYKDMEAFFGIAGSPVDVILMNISGKFDGSGGSNHGGCSFVSGGTLYIDATFANTTVSPVELAVAGYVAELSECFMGPQGRDWTCTFSNGEALSRYCAQTETSAGTFAYWQTGPDWAHAGFPDFINTTQYSDRDKVAIGCGVVYLFWMRSLNFTTAQIVQAGGADLATNYRRLTGKDTALKDLLAAVTPLAVTSDNPF